MRPFWNPLIKDFHLMALRAFKYEVEKMAWRPYLEDRIIDHYFQKIFFHPCPQFYTNPLPVINFVMSKSVSIKIYAKCI